ncbi:MAG: 50S ribosome-binding GTPase, partial [Clostridia bacterium]|nr:50S ribosome-binding GTPase [Clostridia bacterium]
MDLNLHKASLAHVAGHASKHLRAGTAQIAFSGRSNVGKSSMINSLLMRKKLALVSSDPGNTVTGNYYL